MILGALAEGFGPADDRAARSNRPGSRSGSLAIIRLAGKHPETEAQMVARLKTIAPRPAALVAARRESTLKPLRFDNLDPTWGRCLRRISHFRREMSFTLGSWVRGQGQA